MKPTVHVIGAGISGLAAAVAVVRAGGRAIVHETAGHAGGRCRSFFDSTLERTIDNGNHLVLSGNRAVHAYLDTLGAAARLTGPDRAEYPFVDVTTRERWCIRPSAGIIPWWVLSSRRRIPGTHARDYLSGLRLATASQDETVAACVGKGALFQRFWEPMTIAVLNASAEEGAARLLWPVLRETFGRGEAACRPRIARNGLSDCFVAPALDFLAAHGSEVRFRNRLRGITFEAGRATALEFATGEPIALGADTAVIVAVSSQVVGELIPGLTPPQGHRAIVNGHFRLPQPQSGSALVGMVGGLCHWLFARGDVASITISAADSLLDRSAEDLAAAMWREIAVVLNLSDVPLPLFRIIREKRATFLQSPQEVARRPGSSTPWRNVFLAGDWTDTGLPATIEGSVRSGNRAAAKAMAGVGQA